MGANCCVAVRAKPLPYTTGSEVSTHRNIRYSPSWSFRWDNRTHIEDYMDNPAHFSNHNNARVVSETKSPADTESEGLSDGGSPLGTFSTPSWRKSPLRSRNFRKSKSGPSEHSSGRKCPPEVKDTLDVASASDTKPPISIPSTPSSLADHSSSRSCSLPSDIAYSRKARRSPGHLLARQVSDSRIPSLKSLNENSSPEGRRSFVFSVCSNDHSNGGSLGGSSDGWSMRTFSELVASCQRERWSFDSENPSSSKIAKSNTCSSTYVSADNRTCGVCSMLVKDEHFVVAVLICGHVYHDECLETVTHEMERYDPSCPVCTNGENSSFKFLGKSNLKSKNKISRIAVTDIDIDGNSVSGCQKKGKGPRLGLSLSMKSSFSRPFLRRHFSIGSSHPARTASDYDPTRKKGFWARYRRD